MKSLLSLLTLFRKPSAHSLAQTELEEAQRQLLVAQRDAEYANAMVAYHRNRIARLQVVVRPGARQ